MPDERPRGFWRTLPGILTAVAGFITAVSALIGTLAAVGVLPLSGGGATGSGAAPGGAGDPPSAPEVLVSRFEQGCLGFWGDPPPVCGCFAAGIVEALPEHEVEAAGRLFRGEGRFATREQDELARDVRTLCLDA